MEQKTNDISSCIRLASQKQWARSQAWEYLHKVPQEVELRKWNGQRAISVEVVLAYEVCTHLILVKDWKDDSGE